MGRPKKEQGEDKDSMRDRMKMVLTQKINVIIRLTSPLLGTVPYNKDLYTDFIEKNKPQEIGEDEAENINISDDEEIRKIMEKGWTGFMKDKKSGLFIYNYMVKGFLKAAGNNLKEQVSIKNLRSKLDEFMFVHPRRIFFGKDAPDGVFERPIRVQTMKGPRVALIKSDKIEEGLELAFDIEYLKYSEMSTELMYVLLDYGHLKGLGQFRNGGFGSFEILKFEPVVGK